MDDPAIMDALFLARRAYGGGGLAPGYTAQTAPSDIAPIYDYLAPDPKAEYGTILPVARDRETGEKRWAMPSALREGALGILDLLAGTKTGELTDRAAESITLGGLGAGAALAPRGALAAGAARPIKAYHGSPHDFDRFDLSKIGTGEGAQAYGHGLYFAENEAVAKGYRDALTKSGQDWGARALDKAAGDIDAAIASTQGKIDRYRAGGADSYAASQEEILRALLQFKQTGEFSPGRMYEVAIHADPQRFLDWDKPLAQQSPEVADLVNRALRYNIDSVKDDMRGSELYTQWARQLADPEDVRGPFAARSDSAASQSLRNAGIPGIKYLDQGSRAAGDGSRNYVTFDDSIIEILRKYGLLAPAPINMSSPPAESQGYASGGIVERAMALVS